MLDIISKFKIILNRAQKRKLVFLTVIFTISAFFEMLGVSMIVPLVTTIMNPDILHTNKFIAKACELFHISTAKEFLVVSMLCMILVFLIKAAFMVFAHYEQTKFVYRSRSETQRLVFNRIINKPYEYFLYVDSGEIINILHDDIVDSFDMLMTLIILLSESIASIAIIAVIFIVNPYLTIIIAILISLLVLLIIKVIRPVVSVKGSEFSKYRIKSNKWELQAVNGIKDIKVSNKERFFEKNYYGSLDKLVSSLSVFKMTEEIPKTLIELGCISSLLIAMIVMVLIGRELTELISAFAALALAAVKLMPSANRIVNAVSSVSYNRGKVDRLIRTLTEFKDENSIETTDSLITLNHEVRMDHVTYKYAKSNHYIFEDASITIHVGESIGIIGPSGAGKTTAVDIILGLLKPEKGYVYSDGIDISTNPKSWFDLIGYIPQMIFMLNGSIRENIVFGDDNTASDERVWEVLKEAQLADFVKTLPDGIDTQIGERGIRLSGGQRQRIGIARALYNNPELLIFDEATSSLDNETEAAIMESINSLHGKKTMIIIAHRLQTIENCDVIYKVVDKKLEVERCNKNA